MYVSKVVQVRSIMTAIRVLVKIAISTTADRSITNALSTFPTGILGIAPTTHVS